MEAMVNETDIGWYYRLLSSRRIWWMNASGQIHRRPLITMYLACYHSFDNYVLFYSFYSLSIFTLFYLTFGGFRHCQFISVSVAGIQPVIYSPTNVSARHIAQIHLFLFIAHYWWLSLVNAKWFILKVMYLPGTLPKSIYSYSYLITGGYLW